MAFSKAKSLQEAEKCLAQGKTSQAIKLYLNILDNDSSDVSLYNTVGDLYVRIRNITEGLRQFHKLAEAYIQQGFNVKAIAIYRKISKIDPNSVEVMLKLGELYQLQGLGREAREQFLSAAEFFKRRNQVERVLDVTRKLVLLDPESPNFRNRLAAELEQAGKRTEAVVAYVESAETSLRRGDLESADTALKKAGELDRANSKVQLLRARVAISRNQPDDAEKIIESSSGAADEPAGKQILLQAYLLAHKLSQAEKLVLEVFRGRPSDFTPISGFTALCLEKGEIDMAFPVLSEVADQVLQMHIAGSLIESLREVWNRFPQHIPTLELLHRVCERAPDELTLPEVLEALGRAYIEAGNLEKAEEAFQKLNDREPENEHYRGQLEDVLRRLGKMAKPARPVDFAAREMALAPEPDAPQDLSPEDPGQQAIVKEALENSDLFVRYNLAEKAVAELEKVLQVYPDQVEIHQRILEICHKGNPERATAAANALARISAARGGSAALHPYQASTSDKTARAETCTPSAQPPGLSGEITREPPEDFSVPSRPEETTGVPPLAGIAAAPGAANVPARAEAAFDRTILEPSNNAPMELTAPVELDLSDDFEAMAGLAIEPALPSAEERSALVETPAIAEAPPPPRLEEPGPPVEEPSPVAKTTAPSEEGTPFDFEESKIEVDFYLENGFVEEARKTVAALEAKFPGSPWVAALRKRWEERANRSSSAKSADKVADATPEGRAVAKQAARDLPEPDDEHRKLAADFTAPAEPPVPEIALRESPQEALGPKPEMARSAPEAVAEAPASAAGSSMKLPGQMAGDFADTVTNLAAQGEPATLPPAVAQPAASPPPVADQLSGLLAEMEDGGADAGSSDDPETHYNLGVAFREMGLLDEAIAEFQKVAKSAGKGQLPQNFLQACSLLAICFMEKKMPAIAVRWYLRALEIPGLEDEATMALQYDLGMAYELCGDSRHALERFTEVYSQNIDFRDVAEKIRELQQKS